MRRAFFAALIFATVAFAQTARFEAADVHPSPPGTTENRAFLPNGRIEFYGATLVTLMAYAWGVPKDRIAAAPVWLDTDRFDVVAQAPDSTMSGDLRPMLQNLLTERFHLDVRRETKSMPAFALVAAGSQPRAAPGSGDAQCKRTQEENRSVYTCRNTTLAALAETLPRLAGAYFDRPVVDHTAWTGAFDFRLEWIGRGQLPPGGDHAPDSLYSSIEKQLGVRIEKTAAPLPALVVARADRTPGPNPSGVSRELGEPPSEFEVADIRESAPGERWRESLQNGRIDFRAFSRRDLIAFAWNVDDDWVRGRENRLDADRYDVLAKTVPTGSIDAVRRMTQAMLIERFHLKVHTEKQPATVYALLNARAKFAEADASELATCASGPASGERTLTCANTTMEELAARLPDDADLDHRVIDLTGLEQAYDFTLSWSPRAFTSARRRVETGSAVSAAAGLGIVPKAAEGPAGLTIFDALERQLGLRLKARKHSVDVIVVDLMDPKPTDN